MIQFNFQIKRILSGFNSKKNIQFKIILGQFNSIKYSIQNYFWPIQFNKVYKNFKRYCICMIKIALTYECHCPYYRDWQGKKKLRGGFQDNFRRFLPFFIVFRRFCCFPTVFYTFWAFFFTIFSVFIVFFGKKSIQSIIQNMNFQKNSIQKIFKT